MIISVQPVVDGDLGYLVLPQQSLLGIFLANPNTWSISVRARSIEDDQERKLSSISEHPEKAGDVDSREMNYVSNKNKSGFARFKKAGKTMAIGAIASMSPRLRGGKELLRQERLQSSVKSVQKASKQLSGKERFRWAVKRVQMYRALTGYKFSDKIIARLINFYCVVR